MVGTLAIALGGAFIHPFWAILPYYLFAVLQPQYLWSWALPADVRWSLAAAGVAMLGAFFHLRMLIGQSRWNPVATLFIVYGLTLCFSYLAAFDMGRAQYWAEINGKVLLMALLATLIMDQMYRIQVLSWMLTLSLGYLAWHFNSLYLFENRMDILINGLGGLDNNGMAMLLAMAIPFVYAAWLTSRQWWLKAIMLVMGVLVVHAILLTYSRAAMLSGIFCFFVIFAYHRPKRHGLVLAGLVILSISIMAGPAVQSRFMTLAANNLDSSMQSRYDSWGAAWKIIWDHPLTGVGVRNSNLFTRNYGADEIGRSIHNLYLQLAADNGLPSVMVYIGLGFVGLIFLHQSRKKLVEWAEQHMPGYETGGNNDENHPVFPLAQEAQRAAHLIFGYEASLIVFFVNSMFLSSDVLEFQWLLFAVAGAMPGITQDYLKTLDEKLPQHQPAKDKNHTHASSPAHKNTPSFPPAVKRWSGSVSPHAM